MEVKETSVTREILTSYFKKFEDIIEVDVSIVGAGPSGLVAGALLADKGYKVVVFEKKLSPGGGIWGGGMMFNELVVEEETLHILDMFKVRYNRIGNTKSYLADSVETASALILGALQRGVRLMNCVYVEDVMVKENRVCGLVINWTTTELTGLHIDPLTISSRFTIDATGHDSNITRLLQKHGLPLRTPTGKIMGEGPMSASTAEEMVVRNTIEIFPGLYITGMAANSTMGSYRMGPVFGGMFLSGEKAAVEISRKLKNI